MHRGTSGYVLGRETKVKAVVGDCRFQGPQNHGGFDVLPFTSEGAEV